MDTTALLAKYDARVPRYTSYPTAPHFSAAVDGAAYAGWLADLPADAPVSLYLHVPFCDQLCFYCGCNTQVVRREAPRRSYVATLAREIVEVGRRIGRRLPVSDIHWGGGTPTALPADALLDLTTLLRETFAIGPDCRTAIEIDPRHLAEDRLQVLRAMGVTRASLGVQDFDPVVQEAVGRVQSVATVRDCAARLRGEGIDSINFDLIYGLPHQTTPGVEATARLAADMAADRIAVFGYAHVPWMQRHQELIAEASLPGPAARFDQRAAMEAVLSDAGYARIGLDHFARPDDALAVAAAAGALRRNFQGYTTDTAPTLLGFGASAIGRLPQGYAQNAAGVPEYAAALNAGRLATSRGVALSAEDRLRGAVIEAIMCQGAVDVRAIAARFQADPAPLLRDAARLEGFADDGLVDLRDGSDVRVTRAGWPFLRGIAAVFDAYWREGARRHAPAV